MTKQQQKQVKKLCEQQDNELAAKQTSTEARVFDLETLVRISSQSKEGDIKHKEGEAPKEPAHGDTERILQ